MPALALIYFGLIALAVILAVAVVVAIIMGRRSAKARLDRASHPGPKLPDARARR